ncbi:hypothetical protein IAI18_22475 [Acetobacteraceae bacterium H6797]|nr:hypothetical protein [Acetobacteraceae bacterium H6797]
MAIGLNANSLGTGLVARLARDSAGLRGQMDVLTRQSSDGKRAEVYGDIAGDARRAINLRADVARRDAYGASAERILGRTQTAQKAMEQLSDIAKTFMESAYEINGTETTRIDAVAANARAALSQVANLLNEQQAGEYVFGGTDTANPPVPDAQNIASSSMVTDIVAAVQGLAPGGAAGVMTSTLATAQSTAPGTTPFSDYAEDPARGASEAPRSGPIGDGEVVSYGVFANRNTVAVSQGETTGSWSRDLIRGLSMLSGLSADSVLQGDDFNQLMTGIRNIFTSANDALAVEAGALGTTEARITTAKEAHSDMAVALQSQLSSIEDVDLAATLTSLQDVQTRLQASYSAISMVGQLKLTDFLR